MIRITKKADLENALTKVIANHLLANARPSVGKAKPSYMTFHARKPSFHLGDYDCLKLFTYDLQTGECLGTDYCGSYDTIINNFAKQQSEGQTVPKGVIAVFVTYSPGIWTLDVVSSDLMPVLTG